MASTGIHDTMVANISGAAGTTVGRYNAMETYYERQVLSGFGV